MKRFSSSSFVRGWLVGNFEPSLLKTEQIEIALQSYRSGDEEPQHYHKVATEVSLVVTGSASFNGTILSAGEGVVIEPNEANIFKAISDCDVLVIKYPSCTSDKYLGDSNG